MRNEIEREALAANEGVLGKEGDGLKVSEKEGSVARESVEREMNKGRTTPPPPGTPPPS